MLGTQKLPHHTPTVQFFPTQVEMAPLADRMDLTPFGIRLVLRRGMSMEYETLGASRLAQGSFSRSQGRFDLPSGTYSLGPFLGKGVYGESYQAINSVTNQVFAIKVITVKSQSTVSNTIKECIINILLEQESASEIDGPYVPRFYEIAYDPHRDYIIVRTERLMGTIFSLYQASTPEQNDLIVPQTLGDIAHILRFYADKLKFNHRDLKSDNIMYIMNAQGKYLPKLIDFGLSCITWRGVRITGAYFDVMDTCYLPSRDLTLILYEFVTHLQTMFSTRLLAVFMDILTFPIEGGKTCKLWEGCKVGRKKLAPRDWAGNKYDSVYDFINNPRLKNPKAEPQEFHRRMLEFLGQAPTRRTTPMTPIDKHLTAQIRLCLPEQVLNPKTRRCVRRSGKIGRKILRDSSRHAPTPTGQRASASASASTRTRKHKHNKRKATLDLKPCKAGQVRNPATRRCRATCGPTRIRNPATGRCVTRKGAIGKELLAKGVRSTQG